MQIHCHPWSNPGSRLPMAVLLAAAALAWLAADLSLAQEPKGNRLIDQDPFDIVTLTPGNDNKVIKVHPINLPGRKIPEKVRPNERVRIKFVEDGMEYDVAWQDIATIEFYEQMVLAEASRLTAEGKFDEAYEYFTFLLDFYPNTQGLPAARQTYLYLSAGAAFRQQKHDEALAILEELLAQNPNYRAGENSPSLMTVLGNIVDPILEKYFEKQDYRSARTLLARLIRKYNAENEPFVQTRRQQLIDLADMHRQTAREHLAAGRFVQAHDAATAMMQVWPDLEGAESFFAEVSRQYPLVIVGVEHPASSYDPRSLHNPAARRAGRLVERLLVEYRGPGPEGGQYDSPLATISHSDDGLSLSFALPASTQADGPAAHTLARRLVALAQPENEAYLPAWAQVVESIRTDGPRQVTADLRVAHVLPEALLQVPLAPQSAGASDQPAGGPFVFLSKEESLTRFTANPDYPFRRAGQLAEVGERFYADPQRALIAIKQGEVDLVDRIFPGDIAALEADANLVVAPYAAPTTHVLAVRTEHPYLANRHFRRALLYGSNRAVILNQGLLRGKPRSGFRLVSGPFPASAPSLNLPAYGYDELVEPREYDPRLAMTLKVVSQGEVKGAYEKQKKPVPPLTAILLGHPADETARVTCRALVRQWKPIGVECKLVEFEPGVFDDATGKCDLVYLQLSAWEPIVDASRLLGPDGPAPASSAFVQLTLRQLERAQNWQEARERLRQLHRLMHEDVSLLPLFQTMDHYAYRRSLKGVSPDRVSLYQDIERWQAAPQLAEVQP